MRSEKTAEVFGSVSNGSGLHVSTSNISQLAEYLIDTYSHVTTPIREIIVNALEVQPADKPIKVEFNYNNKNVQESLLYSSETKTGQGSVIVSDNGPGMDKNFMDMYICGLMASTKTNDEGSIGGFGIGAKSVMSITSTAIWSSVKDGKKTTLIMSEGVDQETQNRSIETNFEVEDTTEPNGTTVTIPLNEENMQNIVNNIFQDYLSYVDPKKVDVFINNKNVSNKVGTINAHVMRVGDLTVNNNNEYYTPLITVISDGNVPYAYNSKNLQTRINEKIGSLRYDSKEKFFFNTSQFIVRMSLPRNRFIPNREALKVSDKMDDEIFEIFEKTFREEKQEYLEFLKNAKSGADFYKAYENNPTKSRILFFKDNVPVEFIRAFENSEFFINKNMLDFNVSNFVKRKPTFYDNHDENTADKIFSSEKPKKVILIKSRNMYDFLLGEHPDVHSYEKIKNTVDLKTFFNYFFESKRFHSLVSLKNVSFKEILKEYDGFVLEEILNRDYIRYFNDVESNECKKVVQESEYSLYDEKNHRLLNLQKRGNDVYSRILKLWKKELDILPDFVNEIYRVDEKTTVQDVSKEKIRVFAEKFCNIKFVDETDEVKEYFLNFKKIGTERNKLVKKEDVVAKKPQKNAIFSYDNKTKTNNVIKKIGVFLQEYAENNEIIVINDLNNNKHPIFNEELINSYEGEQKEILELVVENYDIVLSSEEEVVSRVKSMIKRKNINLKIVGLSEFLSNASSRYVNNDDKIFSVKEVFAFSHFSGNLKDINNSLISSVSRVFFNKFKSIDRYFNFVLQCELYKFIDSLISDDDFKEVFGFNISELNEALKPFNDYVGEEKLFNIDNFSKLKYRNYDVNNAISDVFSSSKNQKFLNSYRFVVNMVNDNKYSYCNYDYYNGQSCNDFREIFEVIKSNIIKTRKILEIV